MQTNPAFLARVHSAQSVTSPAGRVVDESEAKDALKALAGLTPDVQQASIHSVLERVANGSLEVSDVTRQAFIDAYLAGPKAQTLSPLSVRLPGPNNAPNLVVLVEAQQGGSMTKCARVLLDDRVSFVKSNRTLALELAHSANFEADILAGTMFKILGLKAPQSKVVDISANPELANEMGRHVLDMEFVDKRFAGGRVRQPNPLTKLENLDIDAHLKMLVVDLITANPDRRGPNYFTVKEEGKRVSIPTDNNAGCISLLLSQQFSGLTNFLKTFGHPDRGPSLAVLEPECLGGIRNIVARGVHYASILSKKSLRPKVLAQIDDAAARFTDARIDAMVDDLPRHIIADGAQIRPWREIVDLESTPSAWLQMLNNHAPRIDAPLRGDELFAARKEELKDTLKWRRDHLNSAMRSLFASIDGGNKLEV